MATTNNLAAQASDEPMREAFEAWAAVAAPGHSLARTRTDYDNYPTQCAWMGYQAAATPRATADVERDAARYRWLRDYMASERIDLDDELVEACCNNKPEDLDSVIDILAATKGAKP